MTLSMLTQIAKEASGNPVNWVEIAQDGGALGVLLVGAYLFLTGRLVAGKVAREQTRLAVEATRLAVSKEFRGELKEAVKDGFIEGWYTIHTAHQEAAESQARAVVKAMREPPTTPVRRKPKEDK